MKYASNSGKLLACVALCLPYAPDAIGSAKLILGCPHSGGYAQLARGDAAWQMQQAADALIHGRKPAFQTAVLPA